MIQTSGSPKILAIMGSTRAGRLCPQIAEWVLGLARLDCELIDLREWPLPMDDEPGIPARGTYAHDHTRA